MLRIITTETDDQQRWVLHGQLAGPWVGEFQTAWDTARGGSLDTLERHKCVVDLTNVTFVDEAGARALCAIQKAGVEFIACGVDTKDLLQGLKRKSAPPLRRCLSWLTSDACRKGKTEKL